MDAVWAIALFLGGYYALWRLMRWRAERGLSLSWEEWQAKLAKLPPAERDFIGPERKMLRALAGKGPVEYQLLGFESQADTPAGVALLQALADEDWDAVRTHQAMPFGTFLKAVVLKGGATGPLWALLVCPDDLYLNPDVVTWSPLKGEPPGGDWHPL